MYSDWKTYLILFGGVFALSTSAIFVKIADAPSAIIAFYRLLIAGVVLLPFFLLSSKSRLEIAVLQAREWRQIIAAGLFLALHYVMWFESLKFTSIASSTMLVSMQPLFSLGLDRFVQNRKIKRTALIGCIVALVGCIIIGAGDLRISGDSLFGDILAFAAAGVIALYFFVGETVRKNVSALTYSVLSYLISAVILALYGILRQESFDGYSNETWLSFIGLALIATIGGQFVFNLLLKKVSASAVTMSILGEPIGTCILAYLLLNEGVMLQQFIGIAVIMSGMTIFFSRPTYLK
ncbi:MAG: EamA family transporter [Selenomonadales bacterium]|nr:EamA family transporter [Selenomonadales bacterium]MBQ5745531.1 EamA family transporter [Selenomonadales bacterium]